MGLNAHGRPRLLHNCIDLISRDWDLILRDFSEPLADQKGTKYVASPKFI